MEDVSVEPLEFVAYDDLRHSEETQCLRDMDRCRLEHSSEFLLGLRLGSLDGARRLKQHYVLGIDTCLSEPDLTMLGWLLGLFVDNLSQNFSGFSALQPTYATQ